MKRKQIMLAAGALALGIGAYFLFRKPETDAPTLILPPDTPPTPPTLPTTTTPAPTPAPQVLTIGDKVKTNVNAYMYDKNTFAVYRAGGTNNKGMIAADYWAGVITGFKKGAATGINYAVILGYAYPPKNANNEIVNTFMIPTQQLTKI